MNKRTLTILTLILIILLVGGGVYLYFTSEEKEQTVTERGPRDLDLPLFEDGTVDQEDGEVGTEDGTSEFVFSPGIEPYQRLANGISAAVTLDTEATSSIQFMRRDSGHIYRVSVREERERITNTTIPRIQDALFSSDGNNLIIQYLDDARARLRTYLGTLVENAAQEEEEQTPFRVSGSFLPDNIITYDFSPAGDRVFYMQETDSGSEGVIYNLESDTSEIIFDSRISEWKAQWITESTIALETKPSGTTEGYLYFLTTDGSLERIIGERNGLTSLVYPNLDYVVFTEAGNTLSSYALDRTTREIITLDVETLPEKCTWSTEDSFILYCAVPQTIPTGTYPDAWYRGDVSFNDAFWRIDVTTGIGEQFAAPSDFEAPPVDAIDLQLLEDDEFLIFRNKKDGSLWSLRL